MKRLSACTPLLKGELAKHGFGIKEWKVYHLLVCEIWKSSDMDCLYGKLKSWTHGCHEFIGLKNKHRPDLASSFNEKNGKSYWWAWAWREADV
jgi:hypothetical protein